MLKEKILNLAIKDVSFLCKVSDEVLKVELSQKKNPKFVLLPQSDGTWEYKIEDEN